MDLISGCSFLFIRRIKSKISEVYQKCLKLSELYLLLFSSNYSKGKIYFKHPTVLSKNMYKTVAKGVKIVVLKNVYKLMVNFQEP